MFIHVFLLFPETAGKGLEQIENMFINEEPGSKKYIGTPAWKTHRSNGGEKFDEESLDSKIKISHESENTLTQKAPAMVENKEL